jgi:hypothetical protein
VIIRVLRGLGLAVTRWGVEHERRDAYLTVVSLTPLTRWGQLRLNIFHRGDKDPWPHDHPWDFWTFPLRGRGYLETVLRFSRLEQQTVPGFRWTRRLAEHAHLVHTDTPFCTLIWIGPKRRHWGFWKPSEIAVTTSPPSVDCRSWTWYPWRDLIFPTKDT